MTNELAIRGPVGVDTAGTRDAASWRHIYLSKTYTLKSLPNGRTTIHIFVATTYNDEVEFTYSSDGDELSCLGKVEMVDAIQWLGSYLTVLTEFWKALVEATVELSARHG